MQLVPQRISEPAHLGSLAPASVMSRPPSVLPASLVCWVVTQTLERQSWLSLQVWQVPPTKPQASVDVPATQAPAALQQPEQFLLSHAAGGGVQPAKPRPERAKKHKRAGVRIEVPV